MFKIKSKAKNTIERKKERKTLSGVKDILEECIKLHNINEKPHTTIFIEMDVWQNAIDTMLQ